MKIYVPYKQDSLDMPEDYVRAAKKWSGKILNTMKEKMDTISPVMFVVYLAILTDSSSNILREYLDEHFDTVQAMARKTTQIRKNIAEMQESGNKPVSQRKEDEK